MVNPTFQAVLKSTHIHPSSKFTLSDFAGFFVQEKKHRAKQKKKNVKMGPPPRTSKWSYDAYTWF